MTGRQEWAVDNGQGTGGSKQLAMDSKELAVSSEQ